ncbi:hypothetical protein GCM10027048_05900 [Hymenobacter coalescens]
MGVVVPHWELFYFDRESNLPTYFSYSLLFLIAGVTGLLGHLKRSEKDEYASHWRGLAVVFLALSVDEVVGMHELLIEPFRNAYQFSGWLRFPWVLAGGTFVAVFGLAYLKFFFALPPSVRKWFAASALVYISGVLGMEMLGGYLFIAYDDLSAASTPYILAMTTEETLEMSGLLLFLYSLLRYWKSYAPRIGITVQ